MSKSSKVVTDTSEFMDEASDKNMSSERFLKKQTLKVVTGPSSKCHSSRLLTKIFEIFSSNIVLRVE